MSLLLSRVALQRSSGLDETGTVVWHLALCLLLSSLLVAAALIRGIKSSGKVSQHAPLFGPWTSECPKHQKV